MPQKKIFIAAPFFSPAEMTFNEHIEKICSSLGYSTYMAQRDAGIAKGNDLEELFYLDLRNLENSDIIVANLDGIDIDSGTAWEIGHAFARGKKIIGIRNDVRMYRAFLPVNLMIYQSCDIITNIDNLYNLLKQAI